MKWHRWLASSAVALTVNATTAAETPARGERGLHVEGELLVKFRDGTRGFGAARAQADLKHEVRRRYRRLDWQQVRMPRGLTMDAALDRYRRHPEVLAVEPNFAGRAASSASAPGTPNDPQFTNQWALAKISAPSAWAMTTGSAEVVVAVIDSGVNYHHEDLRDNLWRNPGEIPGNGLDDDDNGFVDDVYGIDTADDSQGNDSDPFDRGVNGSYHGSALAGIIGAVGHNRLGVAGVNWSVRLMALRAIRTVNLITVADELQALDYVLEMKERGVNVRVVNLSYGGMPYSRAERDALAALGNAGILVCAAAGNNGANNDAQSYYPASHPLSNLIAVAGSDTSDRLAAFPVSGASNFGRNSVDLAAPAVGIATTFGPGTNSYALTFFGTSAAAAHVAGAVAVLAAANPAATAAQIKAALLGAVDLKPALTNKLVSHGRLNLARALGYPILTAPPISQAVARGGNVTFSAGFSGQPPPFGVQWRHGAETLASHTVSGPLDFFALTNAQPADAGLWQVVVNHPASSTSATNTFTLTVLADSDGDGLPDAWELAHGLGTNNTADATNDGDGDGLNNFAEYHAGTNPTNGASALRIESLSFTHSTTPALTFFAASNKTYTVLARHAMAEGPWCRVADVAAAGTNRKVQVMDLLPRSAASNRFYRLVVPRSP